ncbi:MAG: hypothetical protein EOP83_24460 [Verrucomicrobiaceae bacterium]|nr:MAG: hypothetical protein EOP83_24460 [Verrucomicrobiaceae bacterium]
MTTRRLCKLCSILTHFNDVSGIKIMGEFRADVSYCKDLTYEWRLYGGQAGHFRVWAPRQRGVHWHNNTLTSPEQVAEWLLPLAHGMERMRYGPLVYEAPTWRLANEDLIT